MKNKQSISLLHLQKSHNVTLSTPIFREAQTYVHLPHYLCSYIPLLYYFHSLTPSLLYKIMSILQLPDDTLINWHFSFVGNTGADCAVLDSNGGCFAFCSKGFEIDFCGHFAEEGFSLGMLDEGRGK